MEIIIQSGADMANRVRNLSVDEEKLLFFAELGSILRF